MDRRCNFGVLSRKWCEQENEFIAENEMIDIIPNFSHRKLDFIFDSIGPFKPNVRIAVPLWLAIELHNSKKCKILLPQWLNAVALSEAIKRERRDTSQELSEMPFYYLQILKLLATNDVIEFSELDEISKRIKDIEELRETKIQNGLSTINRNVTSIGLKNITSSELSFMHSGVCHVLDVYEKLLENRTNNILDNSQSQTDYSQLSQSTNHNSNLRSNMSTKFISTNSNFSQTTLATNIYDRDNDDEKTHSPFPNKRISFQSPHSSVMSDHSNNNNNNDNDNDDFDFDSNKENENDSNFDNVLDNARFSRKLQRKSKKHSNNDDNDGNPQGLPPRKIRRLRH